MLIFSRNKTEFNDKRKNLLNGGKSEKFFENESDKIEIFIKLWSSENMNNDFEKLMIKK